MASSLLTSAKILKGDALLVMDSLKNSNNISNDVYQFYHQKYSNLLFKLEIMSGSVDSAQAAAELNRRFINQSFMDEYYKQCLDQFEKIYISSKVKWTASDHLNLRDSRESFRRVLKYPLLSPKVKDQLLFLSLNNINNFFTNDIETYLKLFVNTASDTNLIHIAREKFQKAELQTESLSNLHLMTTDGKQTSIEALIEKNKGKIIYIDFWASWCAPCRAAMPASHALKQKLTGKDIVFVYLSIDDNIKAWEKASEKEELSNYTNNYLVVNHKTSEFLKINKVSEIPRYIIFDKKGKLAYGNAPRVESEDLEALLIQLSTTP